MKKLILVLALGFVINSSLAQEVKSYHLNGQLESVGMEKDGKRTGLWKFYDGENGGFSDVKDKTKTGPLIEEGTYENGKETGEWKSYYSNGKIKKIYNYKSGKLHGKFTHYNEKGELICIIENFDENNPDIYISTYQLKLFPGHIKILKSSENKLLIEGLMDLLGQPFSNSHELTKVSKHKYKFEFDESYVVTFEFRPYNSEMIMITNNDKASMEMPFFKILK
ncbi:toxin-antitoxin system YwqK family antitoxin [Psychroserpens sp. SPM9]|uniref:toxin-antitoxin system YwqK family antitoxin n=1 Tax=Psychroserpens sp. SPM9 TaxID=2975598 RepID=UPI0021A4227A|nr:hypothetical protein [Psychroserpens sp. SPM9]MDG5492005.1 hypothetical protein [Psychroserpens sp. SPM9]